MTTATLPGTLSLGLARGATELREFFRQKENLIFTVSLPALLMLLLGTVYVKEPAAAQMFAASMIGAGILDGDRVIVKQQGTAENGEIVCAIIDGEATLKRFYQEDGVITLKAENEKYAPITVSEGEFRIAGRVVGLLRKF